MKKNELPLSFIELKEKNLIQNFRHFRNLIHTNTKIAVAIKGNAYGHGQMEVTKILEPYADYFQVDDVEELEMLRKISKKKALVFGFVQKSDLKKIIQLGCTLAVFSLEQLSTISIAAKSVGVVQEIHLPVDAHLGREGFLASELPKILKQIKKLKNIKLTGMYAHFSNIEDTSDFSHAQKQIDAYNEILKTIEKNSLQTHMSATSGVLVYEKGAGIHSLVRLGVGVYGMWGAKHLKSLYKNKIELKPALSWKTKIAQIKILPKGATVGYGLTYKTNKKTKIAIIPQGYADGLDRGLSNTGEMLIRNTRCKIIGRISMNMTTLDISHLNKVKTEDEVVILGVQGREEISAEEIAEKINTINYEVTTRLSSLLPRVIA